MHRKTIWVIENARSADGQVALLLKTWGWRVISTKWENGDHRQRRAEQADLIVVVSPTDGTEVGIEQVRKIRRDNQRAQIILIAANSSEELAIHAFRLGVSDYVKTPLIPEDLARSVEGCLKRVSSSAAPIRTTVGDGNPVGSHQWVGRSPLLRSIVQSIGKIAQSDSNVLITGETGTGKELVAKLVHENSRRRHKRLVSVNCAAIPDGLVESELFGHEKGAFTGADASREGKLRHADGGSIFLDEIGDMNPSSQAKILRVIETREIEGLGGEGCTQVDVRLIAATNQSIEELVAQKRFRKDLFYRLNVARLHLPMLKDHKEDIPVLCEHFILQFSSQFGLRVRRCAEEVLECFYRYPWPGNVRELRNVLECAFINRPEQIIRLSDLPEWFSVAVDHTRTSQRVGNSENERNRILMALRSANGNKSQAAKNLQWSRMTLYRKMQKYHIAEFHRPAARSASRK